MAKYPQKPGSDYSTSSAAFYTYVLNKTQLNTLCSELSTGAFISGIHNIFPDPSQNIRSAHIFPFDIISIFNITPNHQRIKIADYLMSDASANAVVSDPVKLIDVGEIFVERIYKNFLDFPPYTTYQLWLPYIGIIELNADVVGHTLRIQYAIDIPSGSTTAYVRDNNDAGNIYAQRSGIIGVSFPIAGYNSVEYNRQKNSAIFSAASSGATAVVGFATGNIPAAAAASTSFASAVTTSMIGMQKSVIQATQADTMTPFYDPQECYLIINRPKAYNPDGYAHQYGRPSNKIAMLSTLNGFTKIASAHLEGFDSATKSEIDEIEMLLKSGVIL